MTIAIKERLHQEGLIRLCGVGRVLHHNFIQILGLHDAFDALWFDMEHVGITIENLEIATMAARASGLDCFCRLAPTDYASVTRCLEAGASGVMAAQISSAEQAEQFVQWSKFHPRGNRGLNTSGWDARFATIPVDKFVQQANQENFVAIQIETAESVEECDAIAAVEGVDVLFVGPSDLSQNLGVPGDFWNAKCIDAIDRVSAACVKHGKHWGAVCVSPEHADMLVEKGCKLLSPASDVRIIHAGIQALEQQYAKHLTRESKKKN